VAVQWGDRIDYPIYIEEKATSPLIVCQFSIFSFEEERRTMHVLLASEHPDLRLSIELLLSQEPGVSIVGSASETEGLLALIKSTNPDIVILDWDLPGRPVAELLAKKSISRDRTRFIVLCTRPELKNQARQAGADFCLVKGDTPDELLAVVQQTRNKLRTKIDESKSEKE
jgi:DNA-binding NarL/FixJ family response regulator